MKNLFDSPSRTIVLTKEPIIYQKSMAQQMIASESVRMLIFVSSILLMMLIMGANRL